MLFVVNLTHSSGFNSIGGGVYASKNLKSIAYLDLTMISALGLQWNIHLFLPEGFNPSGPTCRETATKYLGYGDGILAFFYMQYVKILCEPFGHF